VIPTYEELQKICRLVDEHKIEVLEIQGIKIVKSAQAHAQTRSATQTEQVRAGTSNEKPAKAPTSIWTDPLLFPDSGAEA